MFDKKHKRELLDDPILFFDQTRKRSNSRLPQTGPCVHEPMRTSFQTTAPSCQQCIITGASVRKLSLAERLSMRPHNPGWQPSWAQSPALSFCPFPERGSRFPGSSFCLFAGCKLDCVSDKEMTQKPTQKIDPKMASNLDSKTDSNIDSRTV